MSFLSSLLLILLLCLSMHACKGRHLRHLRVVDKEFTPPVYPSVKDGEKKVLFGEISNPISKAKTSAVKVLSTPRKQDNAMDERGAGATTSIQKLNQVEGTKPAVPGVAQMKSLSSVSWRLPRKKQGSEIVISSDVGLQRTTEIEVGLGARSLLGSEYHVTKENIDFKENGVGQDVVVMDYDVPHRKPPIHNFSP